MFRKWIGVTTALLIMFGSTAPAFAQIDTVARGLAIQASPKLFLPQSWLANSALDLRTFSGVEIQITAINGSIAFQRSFDNITYVPIGAQDLNYTSGNPSSTGFYSLKGGAYLKWSGTATVLVRGYN